MLYLLKVDALIALLVTVFVFATSGLAMVGLAAWRSAKTYAAEVILPAAVQGAAKQRRLEPLHHSGSH
jgi:hypothetical protein